MAKILIIDDEPSILESLEMFMGEKGHTVFKADTGEKGYILFEREEPEVVMLDIRLPDSNGLEVLSQIRGSRHLAKVIMMTAFQDMETTIDAMKRGAYDYIHKPLDAELVEKTVNSALHVLKVDRETPRVKAEGLPRDKDVIIGKSDNMRRIFKMIGLVCQNRATVLIRGETGTGKELIARTIHRNCRFSNEPFVTMDCSASVETLLESELFGHEKGAFTGAGATKQGRIERAGKGTLFLDELGELPLRLQSKFLGFLQRREFTRVGGHEIKQSRCRIIGATNRDLTTMVQKKEFKEDLYYRLKVVAIQVPPLRERLSDIPELVKHFLQKINKDLHTEVTKLQNGVIDRLMTHTWTGNVRELENCLVEAVVRARGNVILMEDMETILDTDSGLDSEGLSGYSLPAMEKAHIEKTLRQLGWNRTRAAQAMGISRPTLRSKIRKYHIIVPSLRW
ncbi:MAG: sigma-54 dependent transcriptional regulator [Deltaproteobacteria bacterium]|nr:sigma-54 dependent transcriptional regulator [Deltaproteobacteria bacterium]